MISITAVLMRLTCSCVLLTVASAQESSLTVVWTVPSEWRLLVVKHNNANQSIPLSFKIQKGLRERNSEDLTVSQTHSAGLEVGLQFKLLNISAKLQYSYSNTQERKTMVESEIYSSTEIAWTVIVQPKSRLAVWQLVVDVGGNDIDFDYIYTAEDVMERPIVLNVTAAVKLLRGHEIQNGTPFRIKHKLSGRFLSVTTRRNWPAAFLSRDSDFYFTMERYEREIRISTCNSTDKDHKYMYSSTSGNIYFDLKRSKCDKQKWFFNKPWPMYIGDVVSLRNAYWPTAGLTAPIDETYAACLYGKEDEWILY